MYEDFNWELDEGDKRCIPALVYIFLSEAITRYRDMLHRSKRRGPLDYVAWLTRNLTELRIWVEYCSDSKKRTEDFFFDAVRDLNDLYKYAPNPDTATLATLHKATKLLDPSRAPHKYTEVRHAADASEKMRELYIINNKFLSKFAHPTALFVSTRIEGSGADAIRRTMVESGESLAREGLEKLRTSVIGDLHRRYLPAMLRVNAATPKSDRWF